MTLYNFNRPKGRRQPTRKGKPLATVLCYHARSRTAADTLQLTEAGEAQHNDTVVWAETHACKGDGNCLKRRAIPGCGSLHPSQDDWLRMHASVAR